ncbi:MAG: hypothetical protein HFE62_02645 [Firmicutes bacterium]|nr:hypothetical protein [Bacillota bacterium]
MSIFNVLNSEIETKKGAEDRENEIRQWTKDSYTRPNLVLNWNFTNPVNTRGQSVYTGKRNRINAIDKWEIVGTSSEMRLRNDGILFSKINDESYCMFENEIENPLELEGEELTISVVVEGKLFSKTIEAGWKFPTNEDINVGIIYFPDFRFTSVSINASAQKRLVVRIYIGVGAETGTSIKISKIKLERGSFSTLPNDIFADKNSETIKCQPCSELFGTRENMLINWDFRNPVNQRGQNIYSTQGVYKYTIDRWRMRRGGTVEMISEGVKLQKDKEESSVIFEQIIDAPNFEGEAFTASAVVNNNFVQFTVAEGWTYPNAGEEEKSLGAYFYNERLMSVSVATYPSKRIGILFYIGYTADVGASCVIQRVKLEKGRISTLLNDPPMNKETEMMKCLPYYEVIGKGTWCKAYGAGDFHVASKFTAVKRRMPTILLLSDKWTLFGMSADSNVVLGNVVSAGQNVDERGIAFMYTNGTPEDNELVVGNIYGLALDYLAADAEIYD